ncbi:MAG: zinc metallopeptidase [Ruminococcaceae bacterium]|nr:zinc metallopeptidase [Oscillospiraceae bacterium]
MPFFYYDSYYLIFVIPALLIATFAQVKVQSTFKKYTTVLSRRNKTAAEVVRQILNQNGLQAVSIERVSGNLTDHYDPRTNVIRLSDSVHDSTSVAAIGVAAHEAGHAVQHATGYTPIKLRNTVLPIANIGSSLALPLVILGFAMSFEPLVSAGIILFSALVLFQLITLPVEFNASRRAIQTLESNYILDEEELSASKKVLSAAAMTYVAAALVSAMQLLRLVLLSGNRKRR